MSAGVANVIIDQGADWFISFTYEDAAGTLIPLTNYNANLQLRSSYDAATAALSLTSGYLLTPTNLIVRSTTSDTLSTGSTTFTVTSTSAFTVGQRIRAASTAYPENFQEGLVTAKVTDTSVTINSDLVVGSGTYTDWIFSSAAPGITIHQGDTIDQDTQTHILVHATAAQTQNNVLPAGDYVYDLELTSPAGIITRLVQGRAIVSPQVTR